MTTERLPSPKPPTALVRNPAGNGWLAFESILETLVARSPEEVPAILEAAQSATTRGLWAVGFVSYEASPAFDRALVCHPARGVPPASFALSRPPVEVATADLPRGGRFEIGPLEATLEETAHTAGVLRIQEWIGRGETYQVNFTHQLKGAFEGDPWGLFLALWRNQKSDHAAWVDCGDRAICSVSPELFFDLEEGRVVSRPMKGTAARGRTTAEDRSRAAQLAASPKDRAENVMIVDMIRNDLARVARPGTVRPLSLFDVERYASVFQLTSTIEAKTDESAARVFAALFPCASITGAPKINTTRLIRQLEPDPRGVYTGAIGWLAPGNRARFNVAIRTATVDRRDGSLSYGVGGGIVWDSEPAAEHRECLDKALVLTSQRPDFELLETLVWEPDRGYSLLRRHLDRLADSADYFGLPCDLEAIEDRLHAEVLGAAGCHRVRLTLDSMGGVDVASTPLEPLPSPYRLALAQAPVDASDPFLFHKTTHREIYERALALRPEADDVLLWNERRELTESTRANVVFEIGGERLTPPVSCGLLAGTARTELLSRGEIEERIVGLEDLASCDSVCLVNSVRGWIDVELVHHRDR